jgi:hypothetical protein
MEDGDTTRWNDPGFDDLYDPGTLAALDAWEPGERPDEPLPSKVSRWSRSTAIGMVLTGFALGLQEVLDPEDERQIIVEVDDQGAAPYLPVQLFLDPDSPSGSLCVVRRDLIPQPAV